MHGNRNEGDSNKRMILCLKKKTVKPFLIVSLCNGHKDNPFRLKSDAKTLKVLHFSCVQVLSTVKEFSPLLKNSLKPKVPK